jgi:2-polyprenyl-6-methoxyphenol hydroxylase-like FAD-dependent oxidoreductase
MQGSCKSLRSCIERRAQAGMFLQRRVVLKEVLEHEWLGMPPTCTRMQIVRTSKALSLVCRSNLSNVVWSTTPEHAARLESMSPKQFGREVSDALHGAPSKGLLANALRAVRPVLSAAGSGHEWRDPPRVYAWVGQAPKHFPLRLQYTGQYATCPPMHA